MTVKASDFITGDMLEFEIKDNHRLETQATMVIAYIEYPKDMRLEMSLLRGYSIVKQTARGEDLNSDNENFLKNKVFQGKNVIQIREVIGGKGIYRVGIKGDGNEGLIEQFSRCDTLKIGLHIYPVNQQLAQAKISDICPQSQTMGSQLEYATDKRGTLEYPLSTAIVDTSYISTSSSFFGRPPYLFHFHMQYDAS